MASGVWLSLSVLAVFAGALAVRRSRSVRKTGRPRLTDDMIRQLEHRGSVWLEHDEPLDLDVIRAEEERFWREEEWRAEDAEEESW
ncbi:MAG: hypothetical protein ACRELD_15140 [Longimicrobiales bacterium]